MIMMVGDEDIINVSTKSPLGKVFAVINVKPCEDVDEYFLTKEELKEMIKLIEEEEKRIV